MRIAGSAVFCLALAGCASAAQEVPSNFFVFFSGDSARLTAGGQTIVNSAASKIERTRPASVLIAAGATPGSNMRLSESRFAAVREALVAQGISKDLIARSAIAGPKLDGTAGDQRVEITLLAKGP